MNQDPSTWKAGDTLVYVRDPDLRVNCYTPKEMWGIPFGTQLTCEAVDGDGNLLLNRTDSATSRRSQLTCWFRCDYFEKQHPFVTLVKNVTTPTE